MLEDNSPNNLEAEDKEKEYLITEENYQRLRQVQQAVYLATEMSPKIRKLLNALITEENLTQLTKQLIERYR